MRMEGGGRREEGGLPTGDVASPCPLEAVREPQGLASGVDLGCELPLNCQLPAIHYLHLHIVYIYPPPFPPTISTPQPSESASCRAVRA